MQAIRKTLKCGSEETGKRVEGITLDLHFEDPKTRKNQIIGRKQNGQLK